MADPVDFRLADLREKYEAVPSSKAFDRLYDDPEWGHMFAVVHKRLNEHSTDINGRAQTTRHYWAENSRDLLSPIQEIEADLHTLRRSGVEVDLADSYQDAQAHRAKDGGQRVLRPRVLLRGPRLRHQVRRQASARE